MQNKPQRREKLYINLHGCVTYGTAIKINQKHSAKKANFFGKIIQNNWGNSVYLFYHNFLIKP